MKTFLLTLTIFTLITSCKKQSAELSTDPDIYKLKHTVTVLREKFESAYEQKSSTAMLSVFTEWNLLVQTDNETFKNKNDTIKALHEIFKTVYLPYNLSKLGEWEWNNINSTERFVVIQNKLYYSVSESIEKSSPWGNRKDSVLNFRPMVDIEPSKILYLTEEYSDAISQFLGSEISNSGTVGVTQPTLPLGESAKRAVALRPYISLLQGHWGNYWHINTHPEILSIQMNKSLSRAKAYYRVGYMGGEALLSKQENKWAITESKATWIE